MWVLWVFLVSCSVLRISYFSENMDKPCPHNTHHWTLYRNGSIVQWQLHAWAVTASCECKMQHWLHSMAASVIGSLRSILTVSTVWNTGETVDIYVEINHLNPNPKELFWKNVCEKLTKSWNANFWTILFWLDHWYWLQQRKFFKKI